MDLDQASCRRLIALYAAQRALWHPAEAGDKRGKARAWARLAARMQAPVSDLKRKMESLLGSYRREKSRERNAVAGSGSYKSRWYAYELFQFLADRPRPCLKCTACDRDDHTEHGTGPEPGAKHEESSQPETAPAAGGPEQVEIVEFIKTEPDSEIDMEVELEPEHEPSPPLASPPRLQRKRKLLRAKKLAGKLSKVQGSERDPLAPAAAELASHDAHLAFGLYVASELRQYRGRALVRLKRAICDLIYSTDTSADCANVADDDVDRGSKARGALTPPSISSRQSAPGEETF